MRNADYEDEEIVGDKMAGDENEETIEGGNIEVNVEQEKEPIVYRWRRFVSQGEQISVPQPQQHATSVPNHSSDLSPSSGNIPSNLEHVELPLAQRRDTRSNCGKPPVRYGFEHPSTDHDIANFLSYSHLSPAYRARVASLQTVPIPKD